MNLSQPFIQRPIATSIIIFGIILVGSIAFRFLPIASLPQIEFPTILVQATMPGASPEIMSTAVATPLERQIGQIAGITELTSSSTLGMTSIIVQFDLSRNVNGAARDIQAAINAAKSQLPTTLLDSNPTYQIVNPADSPIIIVSLTSDVYTKGQLYDVASTLLQQKLSQVQGVGQVAVGGASLPAVRVELNPKALNQYGLSLEKIRQFITHTNVMMPKGILSDEKTSRVIVTNDQLLEAKDYKDLIISYHNSFPLRLSDVAHVEDSVSNVRSSGLMNGKPAVFLIIFKSPGSNVIETTDRIRSILKDFEKIIPPTIKMTVVMDLTKTIRASFQDVEFTLLLSIFLVSLVIFLFLGHARAALVASIAVPLSILGTFAIMYLIGYTLDNLSLMALTIVTGFVIDDAVVVIENIQRHMENGCSPFQAALTGAKEVGFTILSMSVSLITVFIPILLMPGIVGRLFREFAVTISISIAISLIVAIIVTPMLASRFLKTHQGSNHKILLFIQQLTFYYQKSLKWALLHRRLMLFLTITMVFSTAFLFVITPKGFFPLQDTGRLIAAIQAQQDLSFQALEKKLTQLVHIVKQDPGVDTANGVVGGSSSRGRSGALYISLKPREDRKASAEEIADRLRPLLSKIPGVTVYMNVSQDIVVGGRQSNALYQYTLLSYDLETLNKWVPKIVERFKTLPGVIDLSSDQLTQGLQVFLNIDRDRAASLGVTPQQVDNILYDAFGQRAISSMYKPLNQYSVIMEVAPSYWQDPEILKNIYIPSSTGTLVPLSAFASFKLSSTLSVVNHQSQFPAATISFNLLKGTSIGDTVDRINKIVKELELPETLKGSFQGTAQAFQASLATEPYLIMAALFLVYIVLGILYESYIHPLTVLSTLPSAGVGALLALLLTKMELSIIAIIGLILLIGIVKKNAIMMIDVALAIQRTQKKSSMEAIYEACLLRFRPIMMTTCAAILGALPLALGNGMGSEFRKPLGISIIGGLIFSQMLTLYTTPIIYLSLEKASKWIKERLNKAQHVSRRAAI